MCGPTVSWPSPQSSCDRHGGFLCLTVPRLRPGALVAERGCSFEAAPGVGLIARARERLRCFAEHGARLLALVLSLAEDPPSFPHGAGPQSPLPHTRNALRFGA